jgi:hypothetical protein
VPPALANALAYFDAALLSKKKVCEICLWPFSPQIIDDADIHLRKYFHWDNELLGAFTVKHY